MSEIEKMYEIAGIKKDWTAIGFCDIEDRYPPFTAEKQLSLIKWMANEHDCYDFDLGTINLMADTFEECIASAINNLWEYLTPKEKQQVKEILE